MQMQFGRLYSLRERRIRRLAITVLLRDGGGGSSRHARNLGPLSLCLSLSVPLRRPLLLLAPLHSR